MDWIVPSVLGYLFPCYYFEWYRIYIFQVIPWCLIKTRIQWEWGQHTVCMPMIMQMIYEHICIAWIGKWTLWMISAPLWNGIKKQMITLLQMFTLALMIHPNLNVLVAPMHEAMNANECIKSMIDNSIATLTKDGHVLPPKVTASISIRYSLDLTMQSFSSQWNTIQRLELPYELDK